MKRSEVYRFHYLWGHEAARGEESGRKFRRVCLVMEANGWLYLFPISGQVPQTREQGEERLYEVVPETEQRRIGLGPEKGSHLILDADELHDFDSLTPVGSFSTRFLEKVATASSRLYRKNARSAGLRGAKASSIRNGTFAFAFQRRLTARRRENSVVESGID